MVKFNDFEKERDLSHGFGVRLDYDLECWPVEIWDHTYPAADKKFTMHVDAFRELVRQGAHRFGFKLVRGKDDSIRD